METPHHEPTPRSSSSTSASPCSPPGGPSTYRQVLHGLGFQVELADIERAFHLEDKRFMREFPGVFGNPHYSPMPWFLGGVNYRLGVRTDLCDAAARWRERQRRAGPTGFRSRRPARCCGELRRRGFGLGVISNWDSSARGLLAATAWRSTSIRS